MTTADDHGQLPAHADRLLHRLDSLRGRFAPADVSHGQHMEYAERARHLADHLRGMRSLSTDRHYAGALALARTALEHHLLDRLLFLADRWLSTYGGIKEADMPQEEARLSALKAGPRKDIVRWWRDKEGRVNVLVRGLFPEGEVGTGPTLSPYYFPVDRYDPFTGHKRLIAQLARPFGNRQHDEKWAEESMKAWWQYFTFERLRANLDVNRLLTPRLGIQVDVHHRFLSAFAHPTQRGYHLVYGHNIPDRLGAYDHYSDELVLLYVVAIAAAELEVFGRQARRRPVLKLRGWEDVAREVDEARAATEYFWFLSAGPQHYDRIAEVHTRMGRGRRRRQAVDPMSLPLDRIRYYINPLDRLIRLHQTSEELTTGLVHVSPFERADAMTRR